MLLHKELKLEMLCRRRKRFRLNFVFKYSKAMELRGQHQIKMNMLHGLKERVFCSPNYLRMCRKWAVNGNIRNSQD